MRFILASGGACSLSWLAVFPTTILTGRRGMVPKLWLRNARFVLWLTVGFHGFQVGHMAILCVRISACFRETSVLVECQLHVCMRETRKYCLSYIKFLCVNARHVVWPSYLEHLNVKIPIRWENPQRWWNCYDLVTCLLEMSLQVTDHKDKLHNSGLFYFPSASVI